MWLGSAKLANLADGLESVVFECGFEADGIDFNKEISSICRRNKEDFLGG